MFEELIIFFIVLIISLIAENIIKKGKRVLGPFHPIILRLALIGVIVHEMAHWVMSVAVGSKPRSISVKWRNEKYGYRAPTGSVEPNKPVSFLQAVTVCFAPLYISTWFTFLSLVVMLSSGFNPIVRIIAGLLVFSLVIGAAPSTQDFKTILYAYRLDPSHSLYQIFLICFSGLLVWFILSITQIQFTLDVFYYLSIVGIYLILKGSVLGIKGIIGKISSRNYQKPSKSDFKGFTRRHYKPKKPPREW